MLCDDLTVNLGEIDTSKITDMSGLFVYTSRRGSQFNGIEKWNVSNVEDMNSMFFQCKLDNLNLNAWNVSKVTNMSMMFYEADFTGEISKWNVSNVRRMINMFSRCNFNGDLAAWNVSAVQNMNGMFEMSGFNQDISSWKINRHCSMEYFNRFCALSNDHLPKILIKSEKLTVFDNQKLILACAE